MVGEEQQEAPGPKVWWRRPEWMSLLITIGVGGLTTLAYLFLTVWLNKA